jgi:hypothetical protein
VVAVSWMEPAREPVNRLGIGLDALWSLIYAAQTGALRLALVEPLTRTWLLPRRGWT